VSRRASNARQPKDGIDSAESLPQEAHHKKMSFDEEFLVLLRKHGVEFDPQFVFG
jgi:hypothetical protein